jgi:PAS domain S-box-containing protein
MHNLIHYAHQDGSLYAIEECPIFKALTTGEGYKIQHEVFWKRDKSSFSVEYSSYPIIINQKIKGAVITFTDITERKAKELELYRTNSFLQNLINYANAPIIVWDPDFKITRFNHAFEHLTGLSENEVVGKSIKLLFPAGHEETSMALIRKTLSGERWESVEIPVMNVSGEIRTVLWNSATLFDTANESPLATIAQGQDITGRKKAEEELKISNQELTKLNSEKDRFFSIIAHDLRSPFNSFLGLTQIMAEEIGSFTLSELQKIAFNMRNSAENLFSLLENLLEWSRLQQGLISVYPTQLDLKKLVDETIASAAEPAQKKNLLVTKSVEESIQLFSDENIIKTVLRNLLSNAIKFTPSKGHIVLSASKNLDNKVLISVTDNGIGMTAEMLENLFKLNSQTNRKGTDGEPSTGLGLLICKDLIQQLNGSLEVKSTVNQGATFTVTLS